MTKTEIMVCPVKSDGQGGTTCAEDANDNVLFWNVYTVKLDADDNLVDAGNLDIEFKGDDAQTRAETYATNWSTKTGYPVDLHAY